MLNMQCLLAHEYDMKTMAEPAVHASGASSLSDSVHEIDASLCL